MCSVGYSPNEGYGEERERFWNDLDRVADRVGNRYKLSVLGKRRIWKEYFEGLYNIDTQEQIVAHMYSFDGAGRGNHFGGEPIRRNEVEIIAEKLKKGNNAGKDEITGKTIRR